MRIYGAEGSESCIRHEDSENLRLLHEIIVQQVQKPFHGRVFVVLLPGNAAFNAQARVGNGKENQVFAYVGLDMSGHDGYTLLALHCKQHIHDLWIFPGGVGRDAKLPKNLSDLRMYLKTSWTLCLGDIACQVNSGKQDFTHMNCRS